VKAAILFKPGDMRVVDVEKPVPGEGEALVQVKAVGICASDVHWYLDGRIGDAVMTDPLILGHEFAGVVAEVGPGVTCVKPGDRVAVEPAIPCYKCDRCAVGEYNICRHVKFCGTAPTDGALREFIAWPESLLAPIPDSMSVDEAAMLEPLAVGVYAVSLVEPILGCTVAILGAGAIGLSILQAAKAAGCEQAFITDLIPERLELAQKLGADQVFDASDPGLVASIKAATHDLRPDVVFEAAGENEAVIQAIDMVRPGGQVVIGGIPYEDVVSFPAAMARRKGLTIRMLRRSNGTLERSIKLIESGKIDVSSYATHRFPLERVVEAFDVARFRRDGAVRVVVEL
jgi:L-iditol 2-dehydrogenase